ncbi:PREDICTED: protein qua-1 [Tarenaya hassleriana]|uniref:protein qua-1 n=1 Tax=Tarenaya hassleriana TaxID=28532 RepID=UPI00053C0989|nr:PREDICTED: protein qua-1 [Tarenaya hassleriana]
MNKQDVMKLQTCVLRVNVHCEGCKHKVKKLLQKIEGVYSVKADVEQGKVTVTGNVDPAVLIKKLSKSGKHAELCGGGGGGKGFPNLNSQFSDLNLGGKMVNVSKPKGGKDSQQGKGHGGGGGHPMQQLNPQQIQQMMMMKGANGPGGHGHGHGGGKDMKMPKEQKPMKFADDDEFDDDDDFDEDDDEFDDDFDDEFDDESEDEEVGHGHGHNLPKQMMMMPNKMAPMGHGPKGPNDMMMMMNGFNKSAAGKKGGGGGGGSFEIPVHLKGKIGNEDKKGGEKGKKEGKENNKGGGGKSGKIESKSIGLLGFLKKGKSGKGDDKKAAKKKEGGGGNKVKSGGGADGAHFFDNGPKKGGPKGAHNGGAHDIDELMKQVKGSNNKGNHNKSFGGPMGQNNTFGGQMGHFGSMTQTPMGNYPAVQGLPMNGGRGGGFYPPAVSHPMNQQQYMHMMMNQQATAAAAPGGYGGHHGGDMYHPMMYARPYPAVNYAQPPHTDSYTHFFSDENTDSCSIM